jgi:hypothetical protein
MQLRMTFSSSDSAQTLDPNDNVIETGPMGDCVSVIVLARLRDGRYQICRGSHGGGGIENVNFHDLLFNIPNDPETQIIMISGTGNWTPHRMDQNENILRNLVAHLDNAQVQFFHNEPQGSVNRRGQIFVGASLPPTARSTSRSPSPSTSRSGSPDNLFRSTSRSRSPDNLFRGSSC